MLLQHGEAFKVLIMADLEKITLKIDSEEETEVYVIDKTTLNEVNYLLVAETDEEESDAYILKEVADKDDELTYESVDDDVEFDAVAKVFSELVDEDTAIVVED